MLPLHQHSTSTTSALWRGAQLGGRHVGFDNCILGDANTALPEIIATIEDGSLDEPSARKSPENLCSSPGTYKHILAVSV